MKHLDKSGVGDTHKLPRPLQRLWDIHEVYRIPSDQIYIKIDYWEPSAWIRVGANWNNRCTDVPYQFWDHDFDSISAVVNLSDQEASIRAYSDMKTKLRDQLTTYKAMKLREFRGFCIALEESCEEKCLAMDKVLNRTLYEFYHERPIPAMLEFHIDMGKTAINMWKAKEEQYSIWHLFDLADSWLEAK